MLVKNEDQFRIQGLYETKLSKVKKHDTVQILQACVIS